MSRPIFISTICILMTVNLQAEDGQTSTATGERILSSTFPKTASRAMFFDARINSEDSSVRERVLSEVGYFYSLPDSEYVAFLTRMYQDPDPLVRGRAIQKLHRMWVSQDPKDLPPVFVGYHNAQLVDRTSEATIPSLIDQCSQGGLTGGYAAYVLGLLQAQEAIPALKQLGKDDNIFVRYAAGRALLDCGDRASAIAMFDIMSSRQLAIYKSGDRSKASPHYAASACRGLIEAGGKAERKGIRRLIKLFGYLEQSSNANDRSQLHWIRNSLAVQSGVYFTNSEEASAWLTRKKTTKVKSEPKDLPDSNSGNGENGR